MMNALIHNGILAIAFALLIRFADIAISSGVARDIVRAVCYGIAAIFLLLFVVLSLF